MSAPTPPLTERALPPVLGVQFIGALGLSLVLPFLVFVVRDLGGSAFAYGLLGATYPAMQMVGAPWLGRWSDRIGRRPVLMISQSGTLLAWLVFLGALFLPDQRVAGVSIGLVVLFLSRGLDGLTGGNIAVAQAVVADITPSSQRSRNYGRLGMASNLGFIIGPAVAGLLGATALGFALPVAVAAAVALAGLVLILTRLPETLDRGDALFTGRSLSLPEAMRRPGVGLLLSLYFVIYLAFHVFYTAFPVHAATMLEWSPGRLGIFFAVLSGAMALVQGVLLGWISERVSPPFLVAGGNVLLAGAFACLVSGSPALTWLCALLFALGNGVMWPSFLAVLSSAGGRHHQGAIQGHAASMGSAASVAGLVLGGVLYDQLGPMTFWVSTVVIGGAGLAGGRICRDQLESAEEPAGA